MDKEILKRPDKHTEIPAEYLTGDTDKYFCMEIKGNDYAPYYIDGDRVIFCSDMERENPSNVFLISINGKISISRVFFEEDYILAAGLTDRIEPQILKNHKVLGFPYMLIRKLWKESEQCK